MSERLIPVITDYDLITALGKSIHPCWEQLMQNKTGIKKVDRFNTDHFQSQFAAFVEGLDKNQTDSLVMQMLKKVFKPNQKFKDSFLILATTTGEIDLLEKSLLNSGCDYKESSLAILLNKVKELTGTKEGMIVSSACSSANSALAHAGWLISSGEKDSVLVVACDSVSEFVFSGFSALMALDKERGRPFDKNRAGLTVGEGAGYIHLTSRQKAVRENKTSQAELLGWGINNDANHMTGPSRTGEGLSLAIDKAINTAGINKQDIGSVCAHGTGTLYNDSMEIKAFKRSFKDKLPTYSVKGALGHTMGASGLVEAIINIKSLEEEIIPPTVGLEEVDQEAEGWVKNEPQTFNKNISLSVNSGFGGINAAILLQK